MSTSHLLSHRSLLTAATLLVCCSSDNVAAQQALITSNGIVVPATPSKKSLTATYDSILAHPTVLCVNGKRVLEFSMSFQPKGKDYYGPYKTTGNKFSTRQIEVIKEFRDKKYGTVKSFIEDITVNDNGTAQKIPPVVMTLTLQ